MRFIFVECTAWLMVGYHKVLLEKKELESSKVCLNVMRSLFIFNRWPFVFCMEYFGSL